MRDGAATPSAEGGRRAVVMRGGGVTELVTARLRLTPVAEQDLDELLSLHSDPRAFAEDSTAPLTDRAQMAWVLERWRESWAENGLGYLSVRARSRAGSAAAAGAGGTGEGGAGEGGAVAGGTDAGGTDAGGGHGSSSPDPDPDPAADADPAAEVPLPAGLLGVVGLTPLELEGRTVLSAYWRLSPDVTGHGIASEAMRAVLAHPWPGVRIDAHGRAASGGARAPGAAAPADTAVAADTAGAADSAGSAGGSPGGAEVVAVTAAGNRPSLALAARLGFVPAPRRRPVPGERTGDVLLTLPGS